MSTVIIVPNTHADTGVAAGVFDAAYALQVIAEPFADTQTES
jgi:hypothetical protein